MQCPNCGSSLPDSTPFCPHCGAALQSGSRYAGDDAPTSVISQPAASGSRPSALEDDDAPTSMLPGRGPDGPGGYGSMPSERASVYDGDMPTSVVDGAQPQYTGPSSAYDEAPTSLISPQNSGGYSYQQPGGQNPVHSQARQPYAAMPQPGAPAQNGPGGMYNTYPSQQPVHNTQNSLSTHSYRGSPSGTKTYTSPSVMNTPGSNGKKKSHAGLWILGIILVLLLGLGLWGGLGYLFPDTVWLPEPVANMLGIQDDDSDISISDADLVLVALTDQEGLTQPFGSSESGHSYSKDEEVRIVQRAKKAGERTVYGKTEDDDWLIITEGQQHYLRDKNEMLREQELSQDQSAAASSSSGTSNGAVYTPADNAQSQADNTKPQTGNPAETPQASPSRTLVDSFTLGIGSTIRKQDTWSGPACAVIVLDFFGLSANQTSIADEVITQNNICDYSLLSKYLTGRLKKYGYQYTGVYEDASKSTDKAFADIIDCLDDDAPALIVVKDQSFTGDAKSCYAVVYGMRTYSDGSHEFYVFCPTGSGQQELISDTELAKQMKAAGFICYLY